MEKFLLIIRQDLEQIRRSPEEDFYAAIREMTSWVEELALTGNYGGGEPLLATGRYVSKQQVLSDGPFIEAKEAVSGYIIILAENLDQAASIAQNCPKVARGEMVIEVRPILKIPNE